MTKPQLQYDMLKGVAKKLMALRPHSGEEMWWDRSLTKTPQFNFMVSDFYWSVLHCEEDWFHEQIQTVSKRCKCAMVEQFGRMDFVVLRQGRASFCMPDDAVSAVIS
jgi:hypothetical protein